MTDEMYKRGDYLRIDHPEIHADAEWEVLGLDDDGRLKLHRVNSNITQDITIPWGMSLYRIKNDIPPIVAIPKPMPDGDYHQERKLVNRMIAEVYTPQLRAPSGILDLRQMTPKNYTLLSIRSWAAAVKNEREKRMALLYTDMRTVFGPQLFKTLNWHETQSIAIQMYNYGGTGDHEFYSWPVLILMYGLCKEHMEKK